MAFPIVKMGNKTPKRPPPLARRGPPCNTAMPRPTARTTPNRSSHSWRTVAHVRRKVAVGYNGASQICPQNYLFPWTDPETPLPASFPDQSDLLCQTASGSDPPFLNNALDRPTHRPTDRPRESLITRLIGRCAPRATRPNNSSVITFQRHCVRTKSLSGNNSGIPKPIGKKFYRETLAHVARSPANFWRPPANGRKMAAKTAIPNFLSPKKFVVSPTSRSLISVKFEHTAGPVVHIKIKIVRMALSLCGNWPFCFVFRRRAVTSLCGPEWADTEWDDTAGVEGQQMALFTVRTLCEPDNQ